MRLINVSDLTFKTDGELFAMLRKASDELQGLNPSGPEYAATLASIQILRRALVQRRMSGPQF